MRTLTREGVELKRTIGGWAARIGGTTFTFRRDGRSYRINGQVHKAQPLSDMPTLTDCVLWAQGHVRYCGGGCTAASGPFDSVRVENPPDSPASDDCHTYS